jgi:transcriptional regulator GlxA family with amidase domain
VVRECEAALKQNYREANAVTKCVMQSPVPERTLKRRFKTATGISIIDYVQNLRIEEAKQLLEDTDLAIDEIGAKVGYENLSFFRQLFKRRCGLSPSAYRRLFSSS